TETITEVYKHDAMWLFINIAYLLFAAAAGLLGWFLLEGNRWEQYWVLAATVAAWVAIGLIQGLVKLEDRIDITFDKLKVNKGDSLVITMTNLGKKRHISQGSLEWYMQTQDGKDLSHQKSPTRDLNLGAGEPYCLEWDTTPTTITPGFYRFVILENKEARIQGGAVLRKIQVVPPPVLPPGTAGSAKT
ncbi:MAG TPA: hypothetical protein VMS94_02880, partial [Acidobacteriota bacterium]|nr:hypothetical protein [Acidobacteriota bacterium]